MKALKTTVIGILAHQILYMRIECCVIHLFPHGDHWDTLMSLILCRQPIYTLTHHTGKESEPVSLPHPLPQCDCQAVSKLEIRKTSAHSSWTLIIRGSVHICTFSTSSHYGENLAITWRHGWVWHICASSASPHTSTDLGTSQEDSQSWQSAGNFHGGPYLIKLWCNFDCGLEVTSPCRGRYCSIWPKLYGIVASPVAMIIPHSPQNFSLPCSWGALWRADVEGVVSRSSAQGSHSIWKFYAPHLYT